MYEYTGSSESWAGVEVKKKVEPELKWNNFGSATLTFVHQVA